MVEIAHQSRARATQYNVKKYCTTFRVMRDTSYLLLPLPLPLNGPWVPPTNCYVSNITNEYKIMSASKPYSLSLSMNSMPYQIPNVINNWCIQNRVYTACDYVNWFWLNYKVYSFRSWWWSVSNARGQRFCQHSVLMPGVDFTECCGRNSIR